MGKELFKSEKKRKKEEDEKWAKRQAEYEEEERLDYERRIKEYNEFCEKYKFYNEIENTVELNEVFAFKREMRGSCPPRARRKELRFIRADENIQFIEQKIFYLNKPFEKGGASPVIYLFKAIKKGKGKIKFTGLIMGFTIV